LLFFLRPKSTKINLHGIKSFLKFIMRIQIEGV
jgi:hypothetical protein